jgi:hypothetical protein
MTDDELRNWQDSDADYCDELHRHFKEFGGSDWIEASDEARRVYHLMSGREVDAYSVIGGILSAVAAYAEYVAYQDVAQVLGVERQYLESAVESLKKQDGVSPAIRATILLEKVEAAKLEFETFREKRRTQFSPKS